MPGYVIHIAIAKQYFKKHEQGNSRELEDFIRGVIAPDFTKYKSQTHYGKSPAYTNLSKFLENNILDTAFNRGFFIHLVTDYLFYNYYLDKFAKPQIYDDYDYLNKAIMEKYQVTLPEEVKDKVFFKEGTPQILSMELVDKMVEDISNISIDTIVREVKSKSKKWSTYKNIV